MNRASSPSDSRFRTPLPWLAGLCALIFIAQGYYFARIKSLTWDEPVYLMTGYQQLVVGDFRYTPEHPPLVTQYLALPNALAEVRDLGRVKQSGIDQWKFAPVFLARGAVDPKGFLIRSRMANLLLGVALIGLLAWWAWRLWGTPAAALVLVLGTFEPNLIANSSLATIDTAVTLGLLASAYLLWELLRESTWPRIVLFGIVLGLALMTKFSTTFLLLGILLPVVAIHWWVNVRDEEPPAEPSRWRDWQTWLVLALAVAAPILIVYHFVHLEHYFEGFAFQWNRRDTTNEAVLFGVVTPTGVWDYFIHCLLLKVPLGIWALFIISVAFFRRSPKWTLTTFALIAVPVASITFAMTISWVDRGVRYVLPTLALMILVGSRVGSIAREERNRALGVFAGAMALWSVFAGARIAPHYLAYFNEIAGGPMKGPRYFVDSNIDWGQDLRKAGEFLESRPWQPPLFAADIFGNPDIRHFYITSLPVTQFAGHPASRGIPNVPLRAPDLVWVSATSLYGSSNGVGKLFRHREPDLRFGYSVQLFDISDSPEDYVAIANHYLAHGPPEKHLNADRMALAVLERCVARFPDHFVCNGMRKAHRTRMGLMNSVQK